MLPYCFVLGSDVDGGHLKTSLDGENIGTNFQYQHFIYFWSS